MSCNAYSFFFKVIELKMTSIWLGELSIIKIVVSRVKTSNNTSSYKFENLRVPKCKSPQQIFKLGDF